MNTRTNKQNQTQKHTQNRPKAHTHIFSRLVANNASARYGGITTTNERPKNGRSPGLRGSPVVYEACQVLCLRGFNLARPPPALNHRGLWWEWPSPAAEAVTLPRPRGLGNVTASAAKLGLVRRLPCKLATLHAQATATDVV